MGDLHVLIRAVHLQGAVLIDEHGKVVPNRKRVFAGRTVIGNAIIVIIEVFFAEISNGKKK